MAHPITDTAAAVASLRVERRGRKPGAATLTLSEIENRLASRGITLIGEYRTVALPATFKGKCGHYWRATAGAVINTQTRCPVCAKSRNVERNAAIVAANKIARATKNEAAENV